MTAIYITLYCISLLVLAVHMVLAYRKITLLDIVEALALSLVLAGILYLAILGAETAREWYKDNKFKDPVIWQRKEGKK